MGRFPKEEKVICVFCKGKVTKQKVQEEIRVGNDYVVAEVDAEICGNCHERYFIQGTIDHLLKLKRRLKRNKKHLQQVGKVFRAA